MPLERTSPRGLATPETYIHDVVGLEEGSLPIIEEARVLLFGVNKPADSLVGVAALAHPGCLIEVEAIAAADRTTRAHNIT